MAGTKVRHNFHEECEASLNKQINAELYASYAYLALAAHFGRDDIHLTGFQKYFLEASREEREHAEKLIKYQNLRGGRVLLQPIDRPVKDEWDTPLQAVEYALDLEKQVNQSLLGIHKLASKFDDPHLTQFLEEEFLQEQADSIRKLAGYITQLQRVGDGVGIYLFDSKLQ